VNSSNLSNLVEPLNVGPVVAYMLRNVEVMDVVADTVGAAIAAVVLYGWDIIRSRHGV